MEMIVFLSAFIIGHNSVVSDSFQNIDFIFELHHLTGISKEVTFQNKLIICEFEERYHLK